MTWRDTLTTWRTNREIARLHREARHCRRTLDRIERRLDMPDDLAASMGDRRAAYAYYRLRDIRDRLDELQPNRQEIIAPCP